MLELAAGLGIPARERTLSRMDLISADEVFLTGTGARIVGVRCLDGLPIGVRARGRSPRSSRAEFEDAGAERRPRLPRLS